MSDKWDGDYNINDLTDAQILTLQNEKREKDQQERLERLGYFEVPIMSSESLKRTFSFHDRQPINSYIFDQYGGKVDQWGANKIWAVCHNCGMIQFKNTPRETNVCLRCRSRSVTMLCGADISQAIVHYNTTQRQLGVNMAEVFNARKTRMKLKRKVLKDAVE